MKNPNAKYKPCPRCHSGQIMTDEWHRAYNAKLDDKVVCNECILQSIYAKFKYNQSNRIVKE